MRSLKNSWLRTFGSKTTKHADANELNVREIKHTRVWGLGPLQETRIVLLLCYVRGSALSDL